ncbi:hypothetical protein [Paenibacillus sp. YYML68]|uniref:dTMP kinase n=1 Tax=Paenibacillus sp. YYML68 TaxID=2909250 RepID=UPI00248F61CB|nr:hypothetical protein [Paenibacillus sp. YYML68]
MQKGFHIAFSGTDGSGKSTQAGFLFKKMKNANYPTYFAENNDIFSYNILQNLTAKKQQVYFRNLIGMDNSELVMTFDALRDYLTDILPNLCIGNNVIVPRSNFDRIAKAKLFDCSNVDIIEMLHTSLCSLADLHFFIDVPPIIAIQRINERGIDTEDLTIIQKYYSILKKMENEYNWINIDGTKSKDQVHSQIWEIVQRFLTNKEKLHRMEN